MKYFVVVLVVAVLVFSCSSFVSAYEGWELVAGIKEVNFNEIVADQHNEGIVYAATSRRLYRTENNGSNWKVVLSARGEGNSINFVNVSRQGVFVCMEKGLFKSKNGKSGWKKIFGGIGPKENSIRHIAFSEDGEVYVGTRGGLFVSNDNGVTWQKDSSEAGNISVKWISFLEMDIFIVAERGVYKKSNYGWKRVFVTATEESEYDADFSDEEFSAVKSVNSILVVNKTLFLAGDDGVFVSRDRGENWERFTQDGFFAKKAERLLYKRKIFASTDKGIFVFHNKDKTWKSLYRGMKANKTRSITVDPAGNIWVATEDGLYRAELENLLLSAELSNPLGVKEGTVLRMFDHEPSIRQVQEAAIEYAEVHSEKIQKWRNKARLKPILPEISVDYDKTINYDSGSDRYYTGPHDWGVTCKWDLSDLIWNPSQTSIDIRSKLMVQLRDDILDEVTRTYFERRRLQLQQHLYPPTDLKEKLQKELRIQELTADLDGLTGGYFSENSHR